MATTKRVGGVALMLGALWLATGCAPVGPDDETVDQVAEPISGAACVLTTYDGYNIFRRSCSDGMSFYTSNGNTYSSTGPRTGLEWQCVEWTNRYFHFKWGTPLPWYGNATDKCASHPASVSRVTTPWPGDIVVFRPNSCLSVSTRGGCTVRADATYGHIGIVMAIASATTLRVKDQNGPQNAFNTYIRAAVGSFSSPVQCYLRDSHHVCDAGSTRSCTAGGCTGTQTCASSGRAWGACAARCADGGVEGGVDGGADAASLRDGSTDATTEASQSDGIGGEAIEAGDAIDDFSGRNDATTDGVRSDAAPDAGGEGAGVLGGCGCAIAGRPSSPRTVAWALLLGALLVARRKKAPGSRQAPGYRLQASARAVR